MTWQIKEIEAPQLADWMQDKAQTFRIVDVREPREIAAGTIPGAEAVPLASLPLRVTEFKNDEDLVFICRSGARSAQACRFLQQHGFTKVFNLRGGMFAWASNGLPHILPEAV